MLYSHVHTQTPVEVARIRPYIFALPSDYRGRGERFNMAEIEVMEPTRKRTRLQVQAAHGPLVSLSAILDLAKETQRCVSVEGEAVFNAGHIICCGIRATTSAAVEVESLCLQTSAVRGPPHTIKVQVCNETGAVKVKYEKTHNKSVSKLGLVVVLDVPWLGYSPDRISEQRGTNILLEVKCPVLGKHSSLQDLVYAKKLAFIVCDGENYALRRAHKYYSQVQLGMLLLNINLCNFIIYSKSRALSSCAERHREYSGTCRQTAVYGSGVLRVFSILIASAEMRPLKELLQAA
ncbi:uncharacterized protein [Dermacentor andersoni]|uniref:uncharacterized protein n=1 Tax=Dermacentor andersoni TaxID=34620 RepID=UPI003B3A02B1